MSGRLPRLALAVIVLACWTILDTAPRASAWGDFDDFQTWTLKGARAMYWATVTDSQGHTHEVCTVTGRIFVQEMYKKGVTKNKIRWELKAPQSDGWGHNYDSSSWESVPFVNDEVSRHTIFDLPPGYLRFINDRGYAVWVKTAGERAGAKDFTRHYQLGEVQGCVRGDQTGGSIDF